MRRVVHFQNVSVRFLHHIAHARRGSDEIEIEFPLEPFLDYLHVEKSEKTRAEAEAERTRRFRFVDKRSVVQIEFVERVAKIVVFGAVRGIYAREYHGTYLLITFERFGSSVLRGRDRVAHGGVLDVFNARRYVSDVARFKLVDRLHSRSEYAHFGALELFTGRHHHDARSRAYTAVHDTHVTDGALIIVVGGIEYQRAERRVLFAVRRRQFLDDLFKHLFDVYSFLRADERSLGSVESDNFLDFLFALVGSCRREIYFVYYGNYLEIVVYREICVGKRLRFYALRRVHDEYRAFACGEGAAHFVGEVDVPGRIDKVERVLFAVMDVLHPHRRKLDGDTSFTLDIHAVEQLILHIALADRARKLHEPVGKGALAVVYVRYYAEITYFTLPLIHLA